jgi:KDO2-lipid IV(A) lauroyltransferase
MARHETPDLKDRLEYGALVALLAAMRAPSARRGRGWGRALGRFAARSVPLRREVALENLRAAFPELDPGARAAVYAAMLENLGEVLGGFARFGKGRPEPITDTIRVANPEAFAEAHRAGRGAVLLTAHYGNWEAFGAAIFARYRGRMGLGTLTVGKSLKPLVKTLREGSFVASLADQDGGPGGFFLDFLGRKASVQPGLFRLLARSGVPMVTGFAVRDGEGWRGELQSPVWPARARDEASVEGEARRLAALYTLRVEQYVRARPDHWFWVHRRWRTRPPEELD